MSRELTPAGNDTIERLEQWKGRFDATSAGDLETLLTAAAGEKLTDASDLIRLHEVLLFLRAYPMSERVAKLADEILFAFEHRVPAYLDPFEEPEVSGIAGTSVCAPFSYEVAQRLG